jgi:hypothetical protein
MMAVVTAIKIGKELFNMIALTQLDAEMTSNFRPLLCGFKK